MTIVEDGRENAPLGRGVAATRTHIADASCHAGVTPAQKKRPHRKAAARMPGVSAAQAVSRLSLLIDSFWIVTASLAAGVGYHLLVFERLGDPALFTVSGLIVSAAYWTIQRMRVGASPLRTLLSVDLAKNAAVAWVGAFALFLFVAFGLKTGSTFSRGATFTFFVLGGAAVLASHLRTCFLLARAHRSGALERRDVILLGGIGDVTLAGVLRELRAGVCPNPAVITFNPAGSAADWIAERKNVIARTQDLARVRNHGEIVVVGAGLASDRLAGLLRGLNLIPRSVVVVPDSFTAQLVTHRVEMIGSRVGIEVQHEPFSRSERFFKRAMDILISAAALLFLLPFFLVTALAIKLESRGPVFFRQSRLGHRSAPFDIFKFRSMTVMENGADVVQASKDDARVTRVGAFLRKTSIDELPQLINVLSGEMSLVGPRPHARAHDEKYALLIENYELRQHVKPGITGWAQVNGLRGETRTLDLMYRRIEHDIWYATNCSLWLDIEILARTLVEVLRQRNAY